MSVYFPGTRMEGPFQAKLGRNMVEYQYTERLNQQPHCKVRPIEQTRIFAHDWHIEIGKRSVQGFCGRLSGLLCFRFI